MNNSSGNSDPCFYLEKFMQGSIGDVFVYCGDTTQMIAEMLEKSKNTTLDSPEVTMSHHSNIGHILSHTETRDKKEDNNFVSLDIFRSKDSDRSESSKTDKTSKKDKRQTGFQRLIDFLHEYLSKRLNSSGNGGLNSFLDTGQKTLDEEGLALLKKIYFKGKQNSIKGVLVEAFSSTTTSVYYAMLDVEPSGTHGSGSRDHVRNSEQFLVSRTQGNYHPEVHDPSSGFHFSVSQSALRVTLFHGQEDVNGNQTRQTGNETQRRNGGMNANGESQSHNFTQIVISHTGGRDLIRFDTVCQPYKEMKCHKDKQYESSGRQGIHDQGSRHQGRFHQGSHLQVTFEQSTHTIGHATVHAISQEGSFNPGIGVISSNRRNTTTDNHRLLQTRYGEMSASTRNLFYYRSHFILQPNYDKESTDHIFSSKENSENQLNTQGKNISRIPDESVNNSGGGNGRQCSFNRSTPSRVPPTRAVTATDRNIDLFLDCLLLILESVNNILTVSSEIQDALEPLSRTVIRTEVLHESLTESVYSLSDADKRKVDEMAQVIADVQPKLKSLVKKVVQDSKYGDNKKDKLTLFKGHCYDAQQSIVEMKFNFRNNSETTIFDDFDDKL